MSTGLRKPSRLQVQTAWLVACLIAGVLESLFWLHHGRPGWMFPWWGPPAALGGAALWALVAPAGARMDRFWALVIGALATDAAVLITIAIADFGRGEHQIGRLALAVLLLAGCLLLLMLPPAGRPPAQRLSGLDYALRAVETAEAPMNVMMLWLLRPGPGGDSASAPLDVDRLRRHVADRLDALPAFRSRVVAVPFGLSQPVYVPDPAFRFADHIDEHVLPLPGTAEALDAYCADQAGRRLDSRRPLWRLTLVHGLQDGRQAVLLTIHHCVADGFALLNTIRILLGEMGSDVVSAPRPGRAPRIGQLVGEGLAHQARTARRLPALLRTSRTVAAAAKAETAASPIVPPDPKDTPFCILNEDSAGRRTFARTSLAIPDLMRVKEAAGVTINEVVLSLVAEALRAYLSARDCLPTRSLVVSVPFGLDRAGAAPRTFGNRVAFLTTTLATDIADPWERLITIGAVTARAKQLLVAGGPELIGEWLDQVPPPLLDAILRRQRRNERRTPTARSNIIVSHLRVERPTGSLAGVPIEGGYVVGPANGGSTGPIVVLTSYPDRLLVSVASSEAGIGEPREFLDGLHRALAELLVLAAARTAVGTPVPDFDVASARIETRSRTAASMEQV